MITATVGLRVSVIEAKEGGAFPVGPGRVVGFETLDLTDDWGVLVHDVPVIELDVDGRRLAGYECWWTPLGEDEADLY